MYMIQSQLMRHTRCRCIRTELATLCCVFIHSALRRNKATFRFGFHCENELTQLSTRLKTVPLANI